MTALVLAILLAGAEPAWSATGRVLGTKPEDTNAQRVLSPKPFKPQSPLAPTDLEGFSTKLIPLPIYSTLPNEGSTFGFMPVFLVVDRRTGLTRSIYAPSVSWNAVIRNTATLRWYHYPKRTQALTVIASGSTHVNWNGLVVWEDRPSEQGDWTTDALLRAQRSIFYRFFGVGPDSSQNGESSHTRVRGLAWVRRGYNFTPTLNLGLRVQIERNLLQREAVPNIALTQDRFPETPGLGGSTVLQEALSIRYDSRIGGDYADEGLYGELFGGPMHGLQGSPTFWKLAAEGRALVPETPFIQGGVRAYWSRAVGGEGPVPFYYQSSLGGSYLLRGFTEDRFIDLGAWEIELEQRIRLFQTHIYGVTADWRLDPFIAVGQVYRHAGEMFRRPRVSGGLGFRAWVRPNVLGRVDVGFGGEGAKFYVELGYPF